MNKPREFWIDTSVHIWEASDEPLENYRGGEIVHVIEYSAYAELLPQIEKLVEALERQSHPHVEQFCKERALNALAEWRKFKGE